MAAVGAEAATNDLHCVDSDDEKTEVNYLANFSESNSIKEGGDAWDPSDPTNLQDQFKTLDDLSATSDSQQSIKAFADAFLDDCKQSTHDKAVSDEADLNEQVKSNDNDPPGMNKNTEERKMEE